MGTRETRKKPNCGYGYTKRPRLGLFPKPLVFLSQMRNVFIR